MLEEIFGKVPMKDTQAYEWHNPFRDGRASVNGDPCCWPSPTSTYDEITERVHNFVRSDRRKCIQEALAVASSMQ
jgi:hypothetical protein